MEIINRASKPTPLFFRRIRNIGLILAAVSTALATAPIALPAVIVSLSGYLAVAGSIAGAISQVTQEGE